MGGPVAALHAIEYLAHIRGADTVKVDGHDCQFHTSDGLVRLWNTTAASARFMLCAGLWCPSRRRGVFGTLGRCGGSGHRRPLFCPLDGAVNQRNNEQNSAPPYIERPQRSGC